MQLYCDPVSATACVVLLFIAEHGLVFELVYVDLLGQQGSDAGLSGGEPARPACPSWWMAISS